MLGEWGIGKGFVLKMQPESEDKKYKCEARWEMDKDEINMMQWRPTRKINGNVRAKPKSDLYLRLSTLVVRGGACID